MTTTLTLPVDRYALYATTFEAKPGELAGLEVDGRPARLTVAPSLDHDTPYAIQLWKWCPERQGYRQGTEFWACEQGVASVLARYAAVEGR